ncbi:hypothetical protein [Heyndrickxia oleronia]|nr:hypothetical protein [Heyndrickxia oleronia]
MKSGEGYLSPLDMVTDSSGGYKISMVRMTNNGLTKFSNVRV